MTDFLMPPMEGWTVDDVAQLPDVGVRYELFEGSLLMSPAPTVRHARAANRLRNLLSAQAPASVEVVMSAVVTIHDRGTFFIPDICLIPSAFFEKEGDYLDQDDVLLAIEVLSPSNPGNDLVVKRHYYAAGGISQYWIVDPEARRLVVLTLNGEAYTDRAVVEPGQVWQSEEPFPLSVDPAYFL